MAISSLTQQILLFFVAMLAGTLNSVAGGGSFFTVPMLIFTSMPPVQANTTSTVALWPGSVVYSGKGVAGYVTLKQTGFCS